MLPACCWARAGQSLGKLIKLFIYIISSSFIAEPLNDPKKKPVMQAIKEAKQQSKNSFSFAKLFCGIIFGSGMYKLIELTNTWLKIVLS